MFEYDEFQKQAIALIDQNVSILVAAPTGAGKTCIAEYAIDKAMARGEQAIYTAPIKALSNQKFRDFREKYGTNNVGIITGDVTINSHAPLQIMTTEIYRNRLFENQEALSRISWIVFDEIHYLDDEERGTVWEESLMFSPHHIKFICLSATVPNVDELAEWMKTVHNRDIHIVEEHHRPVPLFHAFQAQGQILTSIKRLKIDGYLEHPDWSQFKMRRQPRWQRHRKRSHHRMHDIMPNLDVKPNRIDALIQHIKDNQQLPCIYFSFARKRTEMLAQELTTFDFLTDAERHDVITLFTDLCKQYEITNEPSVQNLYTLVQKGIAYHHAGMLPTVKEVVERLFCSRLLKLIFTTETFALGINMPAKCVIFDELRKFHGTHFGPLKTREYYQMAGRAGRRGIDDRGFVYSRVNPKFISLDEVDRVIHNEPEPVMSQFNATYATLLNLYMQFGERLMEVYPQSFHYFQSSKHGRTEAIKALERKLRLLKHGDYIVDQKLTSKGLFASSMFGYELLLSEMLADGLLEELSAKDLTLMLVSLAYEPRKNVEPPVPTSQMKHLRHLLRPAVEKVIVLEKQFKIFPETKLPYFDMIPAMSAWADGCTFLEVQDHTEVDEGEIVRYFRMVVQLLRLIREAPPISPELKAKCFAASQLINRGEIDAEKQLRV